MTGAGIATRRMAEMVAFYTKVLQKEPEGDLVHSSFPEAGIALWNPGEAGFQNPEGRGNITLMFQVEDVDREYRRLKTLDIPISFTLEPTTQPWGARAMWFLDPDGNQLDFVCPPQP